MLFRQGRDGFITDVTGKSRVEQSIPLFRRVNLICQVNGKMCVDSELSNIAINNRNLPINLPFAISQAVLYVTYYVLWSLAN